MIRSLAPEENQPDSVAQQLLAILEQQIQRRRIPEDERANDLFYDAMEAEDEEAQFEGLMQVLDRDPAHIDANLELIRSTDFDLTDAVALSRVMVRLAAKRLGKHVFKEHSGHFWAFFETRPYMRARHQLCGYLDELGEHDQAIQEREALLELNPNDNQGIRYELLTDYLRFNHLAKAEVLFEQYPETNFHVVFAWGNVLRLYLKGEEQAAAAALSEAERQNAFMGPFLIGRKRIPKRLPPHYQMGSKEEAICFAKGLVTAWRSHKTALKWLKKQITSQP